MGVDLSLAFNISVTRQALTTPGLEGLGFLAVNRLDFGGRYYDLWDRFEELSQPFPSAVYWYTDEGIRPETTSCYGNPLTYLRAGQFAEVDTSEITYPWDRAILTFLAAVDPETIVILWWH